MTSTAGSVLDRFGSRAERRPSPRVGVTLAAAGSGLIVVGALVESGNRLGDGTGSPNRVPGIVISALVLAAGYAMVAKFRTGPLATAGVAASALAVPPLLFFLTLDVNKTPPLSLDVVLLVSSVVWLVSYLVGPSRGHAFYLGAALLGIWLFVLEEVEGVFSFPFRLPALLFGSSSSSSTSDYQVVPSTSTVGTISLVFGIGYLVAARQLDHRSQRGFATPFFLAGLVSLFWGITLLSNDLQEIGTGIALVAAGIGVAILGATSERRGTTWIGGIAVFFGAAVLAGKLAGDDVDGLAAALVMVGVVTILIGSLFVSAWGEPDETVPGPSVLTRQRAKPATEATAGGAAAGWYADPHGGPQPRYWDGQAWTDHFGPS